jgi:hypothetical protein
MKVSSNAGWAFDVERRVRVGFLMGSVVAFGVFDFGIVLMSFYRLFVFHSPNGASRWKTNNRQRSEQLPTLERQHIGTT